MKNFLLSATFLLIAFVGVGQCPTETILQINSQQQLNQFVIDFPNCTVLESQVFITGNDITDLSPLNNLTSIGVEIGATGSLSISECPNLTSLTGLDNITFVSSGLRIQNTGISNFQGLGQLLEVKQIFNINNNPSLVDFTGLDSLEKVDNLWVRSNNTQLNFKGIENLESISNSLQIANLSSLNSLEGLDNLAEVLVQIRIIDCDALTNLDSFENITKLGSLIVQDNEILASVFGLNNVDPESAFSSLGFKNNPSLPYCSIDLLCENFDNPDPNVAIFIENNAPGCNSPQEVEGLCGIVFIPDTNFLNALLNHNPIIDTNNDDLIQFDEAEAFAGTLEVAEKTITDFTGLEAFVNITGFNGGGNFSDFLSLQNNTMLNSVDFSGSPDLEAVNLKNGNNMGITNFNAVDCPSLEFICVDDVAFAETNFTNIDPQVQFVDDCEFLSVPAFNLEEAVTVFPNPVSETLTISITSTFNYIKSEIYSVSGQKLQESANKQIEMGDLSAGIYFVKVISEEGTITKKIVKQ
ncbi:MAG: hypothetical protein CMC13_13730 [Flavobacteriaceae bacterium]|nr:hypothetical protein [Flavobacteriaceae bacterium]|tara:strand:- start:83691 stop:85265 length:1575 start_codon:yes stop_codon:yes gene_type:complete